MKKILITLISSLLFVFFIYISLVLYYDFKSEKIVILEPKDVGYKTDKLYRYNINMERDCVDIKVESGFNYLSFYIYFEDYEHNKIDVDYSVNSNVVSFENIDYIDSGQKYKLVSHVNVVNDKIVICFIKKRKIKNFVIDYPLAEIR